jgi:subtilisin-like proprotein convertase family protein
MNYLGKIYRTTVIVAAMILIPAGISRAATFVNPTPITINDAAPASLYPSTITVPALSGYVSNVKVTLNGFAHTFPDDVGIVLVGPTGAALLLQDGAGDNPDMNGIPYTLTDDSSVALPDLTSWTSGNYKPTNYYFPLDNFPAPGPGTAYGNPGPAGAGTATFTSTFFGTVPQGAWSLYVVDFVGGDSGSISGGWTLQITAFIVDDFGQRTVDFNGDGRTDWAVVRNTGGGPGGQATWFTQYNNQAGGQTTPWGIASDVFLPEDFDGDLKTDLAVWRADPNFSAFYILQSTTNTVRIEGFGMAGDDPTVVGDYNADGKCDLAVFRPGVGIGQPSFWFYRSTPGGPYSAVQWGQTGDFPVPGDFDADGKYDFVVQRNDGNGQARFWTLLAGGATSTTVFGHPFDTVVPGDYENDGKTDIAVIRGGPNSTIVWYILPSSGGGSYTQTVFGNSGTDFSAQGDYDGDGKTDIAVWRPSPGQSAFYVNRSSGGGVDIFFWGLPADYPVANYNSH